MRKLKENWFNDLKVGDEVIINEKVGKSGDYPFCFVEDMHKNAGNTYTIKNIIDNITYSYEQYKFYNGDRRKYYLHGLDFNWHSSMFTPIDDRFYEGDSLTLKISISEIRITL